MSLVTFRKQVCCWKKECLFLSLFLSFVLPGLWTPLCGQTPSPPFAYVANTRSNNVSVINTACNTVVATVPVGLTPFGVAITPNGAFAYVANGGSNSVSVINTASNTVVATVRVGLGPLGVAITPNGAFTYVANTRSDNVSVINTSSNTVVATITVQSVPEIVAITPEGDFAYVTNNASDSVSVIDTASNTVVDTVRVGSRPVGVAITPDGVLAYVANLDSDNASVIETATNTVVDTVPVGSRPWGLAITPDGAFAYVSNHLGSGSVQVIETATNTVVDTVPVGNTAAGVAITPRGAFAYVANHGSNNVSVINTATNTVVATVPVGEVPYVVAISRGTPNATLNFPLKGSRPGEVMGNWGPYTAPINSLFDHTMADLTGNYHVYGCDEQVQAYSADLGNVLRSPWHDDCRYGYSQDSDLTPFDLDVNYVGGAEPPERRYLFYDGHPGIDYRARIEGQLGTEVYAAVSGTVRYPRNMLGLGDGSTYGTFHVLELVPDGVPSFRIYYLHLSTHPSCLGPTIPPGCLTNRNEVIQNPEPGCPNVLPVPERGPDGQPIHVQAGCLIARSGEAGSPGAPHLHFEVHRVLQQNQVRAEIWPTVRCRERDLDKACVPVDPYGWYGDPDQRDPYRELTDVSNCRLWEQ